MKVTAVDGMARAYLCAMLGAVARTLAACGGPSSAPVDLCHLGDEVIAYRHALGQPRVPATRIYSVANPPVWAMPCDGWRAVVLDRVPGQARVRPADEPWLEAGWIGTGSRDLAWGMR